MPIYRYRCSECGREEEIVRPMSTPRELPCPACSGETSFERQVSRPKSTQAGYHTPIEMHSVAVCSDHEIQDLQRKVPNLTIATDKRDPMYGVPIAENLHQKKAILRASGFVDSKGYD